jgi:hypothetical protein
MMTDKKKIGRPIKQGDKSSRYEYLRQYYLDHKEMFKLSSQKYRAKNLDQLRERERIAQQKRRDENPEASREYMREYMREYRKKKRLAKLLFNRKG